MSENARPILLIAEAPHKHTPALQRGFDLAQRTGAPVHLHLFAYDALIERSRTLAHPDVMRRARRQYLDERITWLEQLAARWRADGLTVATEVTWAPTPHEAIISATLDLQPALVVKDAGHEPVLRRLLYTALDWRLLRYCPAPLMLVRPLTTHLPQRILAAVDTFPAEPEHLALNDRIVHAAAREARACGATLHLAHVFPYIPYEHAAYRTIERVYESVRAEDAAAFTAFAEQHAVAPEARHWLAGNPVAQLAELVRANGVDLAVFGSVHRTGLERLLLGGTAEALLQQLPCDVMLVKPEGFASGALAAHLDLPALRQRVCREAAEPLAATG